MNNPLRISLVVTGIGMLALFLALFVLYCLMYLMTTVLRDRPSRVTSPAETEEELVDHDNGQLVAAAIAIALARAELELTGARTATPGVGASAWRALHHQRQLSSRIGKDHEAVQDHRR